MNNDGQRLQGGGGGVPRLGARSNGFFSLRTFSNYLRIVSSGASTVASTVRSAGASVASSIVDREDDASRDQVQWAGFDKLECEGDILRQVLMLGYRSGFQVWDVEEADDVRELVSRYDGSVSFLQMQQKPLPSKRSADKFADVRPLLVVVGDSGGSFADGQVSPCIGSDTNGSELGNGNPVPTIVRFYSLRSYSYVHALKFRTAIFSVRCSPRVVAVSQAAQIHCFDAATLEREYTILTYPIVSGCLGFGGYGPLAVGPRWLAYSGTPVAVSDTGRVSPQHFTSPNVLMPPNGSLVAHYAKESSKQLAAGIVTLGDMGYKKLSRYCSERNISLRAGNNNSKSNGVVNGHLLDDDNSGMVIVRDIVSKSVVAQFRAHKSPIASLCFDPSGMLLVTASVQGHNINVFRIMPSSLGSSSCYDMAGSHVHLYRLQRGYTNAVIQDICFSNDSQWIMISSSRGTSHLFAISPSGGTTDLSSNDSTFSNGMNGFSLTAEQAVRWPPSSGLSKPNQQTLSISGPPVTLSVVSRIRNGNNSWRGTVSGAAAAATGRTSSLSGAIASAFHNCKGKGGYPDSSLTGIKQHLLVFSPSGCVIQYALRLSTGVDSGITFSGLNTVPHETTPDADVRLVVEPLQKWDVSHRQSRREREDNTDIYGEPGCSDSTKIFPKVVKKGNSVYPTNSDMVREIKHNANEKHHLFISEAELHMHPATSPLWAKSAICLHVMLMDDIGTDSRDALGGEIEVERLPSRMVEARPKSLVPAFDHLQTPKFQQSRSYAFDDHRNGTPLCQKPENMEDGQHPRQCSVRSPDDVSEGSTAAAELHSNIGWGNHGVLTESTMRFVNNRDNPMMKTQFDRVNSRESPKLDAQLEFVNNRESMMMGTHFVDDNNESD